MPMIITNPRITNLAIHSDLFNRFYLSERREMNINSMSRKYGFRHKSCGNKKSKEDNSGTSSSYRE